MRDIDHVNALVDLIRFFESGGSTDAPAVSDRYGCSLRTAERWLLEVQRWVPLQRRRGRALPGQRYTYRRAAL